jgi:DNA-binding transcriptional LysR family regulator
MDRFEQLQAFVTVVDRGGFAAAARHLQVSRSAVHKLVTDLENQLGAQLLRCTTRQVNPTATGLAFYDRCVQILADLAEAQAAVSAQPLEPKGPLKINAPLSFGIGPLAPVLVEFARQYPQVQVQLTLDDRPLDPLDAGYGTYDLHIRIGDLNPAHGLGVEPVAPMPLVLCAAPHYLSQRGFPATPQDLAHHACLHYGHLATGHPWKFATGSGEVTVPVKGQFCCNNGDVLRRAAVEGLGLVLLPQFLVGEDLEAGTLVPVLCHCPPPPLWLQILYPRDRHFSSKVKLFTAFLIQQLGNSPPATAQTPHGSSP